VNDEWISRHLSRDPFFDCDAEPVILVECEDVDIEPTVRRHPSFPRVLPPTHEQPGVKNHWGIKQLLWRSGIR
jgi:hypothetical protein